MMGTNFVRRLAGAAVVAVVLVVGLVGTVEATQTWDCGATRYSYADDAVICSLDDDGTFTVSGQYTRNGRFDMYNYDRPTIVPWSGVRDSIKRVVVELGVTSIGENAFYGCKNLTEVRMPDYVDSIRSGAFLGCVNLSKITIPSRVTYIGGSAFAGCAGLAEMTVLNPNPPTINDNIVGGLNNFVCLYVPDEESVGRYREANRWKDIECIRPISEQTSIRPINNKSTRAAAPAFVGLKSHRLHLTLPAGSYSAALISINGRVVTRANITSAGGLTTVDLRPNNLSSGAYLLEVRRKDGVQAVRERVSVVGGGR